MSFSNRKDSVDNNWLKEGQQNSTSQCCITSPVTATTAKMQDQMNQGRSPNHVSPIVL